MNLYDFQTVISMVASSMVLFYNTYQYPWASQEAMVPTAYILMTYNIIDAILGAHQYIRKDPATLLHHICVTGGIYSILDILRYHYDSDIYRLNYWLMMAEVTTVFNNIRILTRKTSIKKYTAGLFAVCFLVGRTSMTVGIYYNLYQNRHFNVLAPVCFLLTTLNVYWGRQLYYKIANTQSKLVKYEWQFITQLTVFIIPIGAIDAMNHQQTYLATALWMCTIMSFLHHYNLNMHVIDIVSVIHVILAYLYFTLDNFNLHWELALLPLSGTIFWLSYIVALKYQGFFHGTTHLLVILTTCLHHRISNQVCRDPDQVYNPVT